MALPKVSTPTYELVVPSTGKKVSYRPFLVKEEKTLLMAMESGNPTTMSKAMKDIIKNCTDGEVPVNDLAPFDVEYFFLQLRGRSVGDTVELKIPRPEDLKSCCEEAIDEDFNEITIDISTIELDTDNMTSPEIEISEDIGLKLKYPQMDSLTKLGQGEGDPKSEDIFNMIIECIDYIWQGDEMYKAKDHTRKELNEFIDSLNTQQFNGIRNFFESMPRLRHNITWSCPHCNKDKDIELVGIDAFFG